jgi:zinc protease
MKNRILISASLALVAVAGSAMGGSLISDAQIKQQKELVTIGKLKNGIPVIHRLQSNSEIAQLHVSFGGGIRTQPKGSKTHVQLLFASMTEGSQKYPKAKVFETTEKYALELGCSGGIESADCSLGTLNEYWADSLDLFQDVIQRPALVADDVKRVADRQIFELKSNLEDPGKFSNEVVNRVFYADDHPYRQPVAASIDEMKAATREQLVTLHGKVVVASNMIITIVTSLPQNKVMKDLDAAFGGIAAGGAALTPVPRPQFDEKKSVSFEGREIPTAYIKIKFNGLPANHKDEVATNFMIKVFDEELSEEIRTKRSLSYSVFSMMLQYEQGIGVISASTSKPKETLEAIQQVIQKMKSKTYTPTELEEHKTVYATNYFLTQETHQALAGAIASTYFYKNDLNYLFEMPRKLDQVTADDVKRLANELLVNMRVGVVYDKKKYKADWAKKLVAQTKAKKTS